MGEGTYSLKEAAEILNLSPATVRTYCSKGKIPAKKIGRSYRISPKALQDWAVSSKRGFKYKNKDGNIFKVEICSLAQPGEPRPSFFYIFIDEDNGFFLELLFADDFMQRDAMGLSDFLGFVYQAIDSNIREPKRIVVSGDGISYEDLVPDVDAF